MRVFRLLWLPLVGWMGCSLLAPSEAELGSDYGKTDSGVDTGIEADAGVCSGQKVCAESCVELDDPAYGCTPSSCEACAPIDHATPSCVNESCGLVFCEEGWLNPDENAANGCEVELVIPATYPSRGLVLHLAKDAGVNPAVPFLWEDTSGNDWNATGSKNSMLNPFILTNDAIWFDGNGDYLSLGARGFNLRNGFTLALVWASNPGGKIFALDTPAGRLAFGPKDASGALALQLGSTAVTSEPTGKTGDMLTVVQQTADGNLTLVVNASQPRAWNPASVQPLDTSTITEGSLGTLPDGTDQCEGSIHELLFYVHASGEPAPKVSEIVAYLLSRYDCCEN